MYNIDYKYFKKNLIYGFIFLVLGILFLSLYMNYVFSGAIKKLIYDEKTIATDIDLNCYNSKDDGYICSPVYKFKVNNKFYLCETKRSSKLKPSGKDIYVYYDINDPNDCVNDYESSVSIYSYVILFLPLFSFFFGIIIIINSIIEIKKLNYLEKNGILIENLIYKIEEIEIKKNKKIKVIGVDYKLPDKSIIHIIKELDKEKIDIIGYIDLLIDKNDLKNYYLGFNLKNKNKKNY